MEEKLKYRVGEEVFIRANVIDIDNERFSYRVKFENYDAWLNRGSVLNHNDLKPLPKVTPALMRYYEKHKEEFRGLDEYLDLTDKSSELADWLFFSDDSLKNQHALATLIAYGPEAVEVEKEKRYRVLIKDNLVVGDTLTQNPASLMFTFSIGDGSDSEIFTKNELEEWGFGDVFDNPMFEIEEVE